MITRRTRTVSQLNMLLVSLVFFLLAIAVAGSLFDITAGSNDLWLLLLATACVVPALIDIVRGRFDIFEPVHAVAFATFVYMMLIPVLLARQTNGFVLGGISYAGDMPKVAFLSLLSLLGFYVGYYQYRLRPGNPDTIPRPDKGLPRHARRWAILIFAFFVGLVALWLIVGRVPLNTLWIFGEADYTDWRFEAQGVNIGYLYAAREALPACVLLLIATRSRRRWPLGTILIGLGIAILFAGMGNRSRLVLLLLGVAIFYYLERNKKPAAWQIIAAGAVIFYGIVGAIGFFRILGRSVGMDEFSLDQAWNVFVASSGIAVTAAALVHWIPSIAGYELGRGFLNLLITPIPRFLWPAKPFLNPEIIAEILPTGAAPPLWTIFYVEFGPIGVIGGMAVLGVLAGWVYQTYRRAPDDLLAKATLALLFPLTLKVIGRGHISLAFFTVVYVFAPIWIMRVIYRWQHRKDQPRHQSAHSLNEGQGRLATASGRASGLAVGAETPDR